MGLFFIQFSKVPRAETIETKSRAFRHAAEADNTESATMNAAALRPATII